MSTQQVDRIRGRFEVEPTRQAAEGSVAVSHLWVDEKQARRRSTGRWYRLTSPDTGRAIFRVLTFDPTIRRGDESHAGGIVIDWTGWLMLTDYAEDTQQSLELELRRARWWNYPRLAVTHPNPVSRVALQVSAVAFVLGIIPFLAWLVEGVMGLT